MIYNLARRENRVHVIHKQSIPFVWLKILDFSMHIYTLADDYYFIELQYLWFPIDIEPECRKVRARHGNYC